jgi:hypothetical protein
MLKFEQNWNPAYLGAEGFKGELNDAPFIASTEEYDLIIDSTGISLNCENYYSDLFLNLNFEKASEMVIFIENLNETELSLFFNTFEITEN